MTEFASFNRTNPPTTAASKNLVKDFIANFFFLGRRNIKERSENRTRAVKAVLVHVHVFKLMMSIFDNRCIKKV